MYYFYHAPLLPPNEKDKQKKTPSKKISRCFGTCRREDHGGVSTGRVTVDRSPRLSEFQMPHFCNECCDITFLCLCCRANLSFLWVPQGRSRTKVEKLASLSSDKAARMQASAGCGCESQAEMLFKRLREWGGCGWDLSVASVYQCGNRQCCEQVPPLCHGVVPACLPGQDLSTVVVEGGPAR